MRTFIYEKYRRRYSLNYSVTSLYLWAIEGGSVDRMKDIQSKKELREAYMEREIIGGVFVIVNTLNNKLLLEATTDLRGAKNRFAFSQKTGSCTHMKLQDDWSKHGGDQFALEVLEELARGDSQTQDEFKADVSLLKEIWLEKLSDRELY